MYFLHKKTIMIPSVQRSYIACSQGRGKCYKVGEANWQWPGTGVDSEGTVGRARVGIGKVSRRRGADRPKASRSER